MKGIEKKNIIIILSILLLISLLIEIFLAFKIDKLQKEINDDMEMINEQIIYIEQNIE